MFKSIARLARTLLLRRIPIITEVTTCQSMLAGNLHMYRGSDCPLPAWLDSEENVARRGILCLAEASKTLTRRSTRVRARIPVRIVGLDAARPVCLSGETLIVNAHGCAARFPQTLEVGTPVRLQVRETEVTARVAICLPLGENPSEWVVGFELDTPRNIWGLEPFPEDWGRFETEANAGRTAATRPPTQLKMPVWPLASPSVKDVLSARPGEEDLQKQLTAQQEAIAGLQDRLANSLASVPESVQKQVSDAQEQTLAQVRQQLSAVTEQFELLSGRIEQKTQAAFQAVQEQARAELERSVAQARSQEESATEQRQVVEASEALQKELEQARGLLESSMQSLPERIHQPIATAVEDALAQARAEMSRQLARELDSLRNEREASRAHLGEIGAKREELQQWLAEQQALCMQNASQRLEQLTNELASRAASALDEKIKAEVGRELDSLRNEREASRAHLGEIGAKREELQQWLAEQQALCVQNASQRLEQLTNELASRAASALDEKVRAELTRELDSLRSEREASRAHLGEIGAQREELQQWLAEQQALCVQNASQRLEQLTNELASRAAGALDAKLKAGIETQTKHVEADLNQRLGPMLSQTIELRQEMLSLLSALQTERERGEARVDMLLKEKDGVDAWMAERVTDFQRMFHDALVETTGQIKGRLHMAVEMFEQPLAKLRDESAQQLQEQAGRQARLLREQVDEVCARLERLQCQVENAVRESLRTQATETSASFGREIAVIAQRSVEEWRSALARNLESVAGILGQQLPDVKK